MASVQSAIAAMARNIEEKTGKTVQAWAKISKASGIKRHGELVSWLKTTHQISHGYANYIAKEALKESDVSSAEDQVAAQYAGNKAGLKPLYDELIKVVRRFGSDIEIAPKKANVSIRRHKQFAIFQPTTQSRLDVGLILKGVKPSGRLEPSGSFNAMFTHRVRVSSKNEIDAELKSWLRQAYDEA